jgi:hypothetical protein
MLDDHAPVHTFTLEWENGSEETGYVEDTVDDGATRDGNSFRAVDVVTGRLSGAMMPPRSGWLAGDHYTIARMETRGGKVSQIGRDYEENWNCGDLFE